MVTSPDEWKILELDENPKQNKKTMLWCEKIKKNRVFTISHTILFYIKCSERDPEGYHIVFVELLKHLNTIELSTVQGSSLIGPLLSGNCFLSVTKVYQF